MTDKWAERMLGELTDNFDAVRVPVKQADRQPGPYPYYGASGVVDRVDDYLFDGEYLLIAEDGENLRTRNTPIAFLANGKFWVNNHAHIVRGNHKTNTRYLMYALSELDISGYLTGSTMPKLTQGNMNRISLLTPLLPEQRAIAHILGTLDDKIELNRRMNETLEAMARALFKSWFVDFDPVRAKMAGRDTGLPQDLADLFPDRLVDSDLGEIPEGWRIRQLGEMAIVVDYLHSRKPERQKDGPVLIQVFNIGPTGRLDFSNPYNVTEDDYAEWTRRMEVLPGDLVVTKTGRVGAVGQMPKGYKAAMGRNMVGVRAILGRSLPGFLKDSLLSDRMCREMMRNTNDGTILRSLHVKAISQLQEVLPPYDLVSSYEALIAPVHAKLEQNDVESKTLATMRDVLLPKLVSGEIHLHAAERAVENIQ